MKRFSKLIVIGNILFPLLSQAHTLPKKDSTEDIECLKVVGIALDEKGFAIDGVEVKLFKQNDMMEQIEITSVEHHTHSFSFMLESNSYYTIKVSKPGFVERSVGFYTELPEDTEMDEKFLFEFEVVLFKEKKMDDYYLDFPIALIHYNKETNRFENAEKYTKYIKEKIKEAEDSSKAKNELPKKDMANN
ncbi:MAG: hypothetical protein HY062_10160 [Bacteroidetes bacterium]|nr:hypothetical protein [Bacteroidota bacterium]